MFKGNLDYVQFQDETVGHFVLTGDEIRNCVEQTGARLIIVDSWQQFMNGNASSSDNSALRKMICDVQTAADESGAAVVLAGNFKKNLGSDIRRGIGGSELNNTLRSLTVQDDPNKAPAMRILCATKISLLGKEMTPVVIRQDENWGLSFEEYDADDENAFDDFMPDDLPVNQPVEPLTFPKTILQDGPLDRNRIENLAKVAGIKMNRLYRIREEAGVVIEKQGDKSSVWRLDSYIT